MNKQMKRKLTGTLLLALLSTALFAQTVQVEIPEFAGKNLLVTLKKSLKSDTIFNARLDSKGLAAVRLPMSDAGFSGIASFGFNPQEGIDLIINRKGFVIKSMGKNFSPENIQFVNSEENTQFLAWTKTRMLYEQKSRLIAQLSSLYKPEDAFYAALTKEIKRLETAKPTFKSADLDSWYAPRFARLIDFLTGNLADLQQSNGEIKAAIAVRSYTVDSLDIEALYTSGLWYNIINGFLEIYQPQAPFHNSFGNDMSMVLARTASLPVYEAFASDVLMICQQFGWDRAQDELVNFLLNENRIKNPANERLKALLAMASTAPGNLAPPISGIERFSDGTHKTLLVFYESNCENCKRAMADLKTNFKFFTENNVRIISIAADTDENAFKAYAAGFPWEDKISDFKGFHAGNFKTYGVMATPTMFLLDKDNKIISRFSNVNDIIVELKK